MKMRNSGTAGFTFVELLVVILIIAILATTVTLVVRNLPAKARMAKARTDVAMLAQAVDTYAAEQGRVPTAEQGLLALCKAPDLPPVPKNYPPEGYLNRLDVPKDPWGNPYVYMVPGPEGKPYEILSYGGDGEPSGDGEDADISNLRL